MLKEVVIRREKAFTAGTSNGRAIGDDTKVRTMNFFGDNPGNLFEGAIVSFIQVPLIR